MGTRGPVPKASDERIRRNKPEGPELQKVSAIGTVIQPDLGIENAHQLVIDFYQSLGESAQSKLYQPSDWQTARIAMFTLNEMLNARDKDGNKIPLGAMKLQVLNQMFSSLMATEGDRRRLNIEVAQEQSHEGNVVHVADVFRQKLSQQ